MNHEPYQSSFFELTAEGAVLITAAVAVFFFGQNTPLMSLIIGLLILARFIALHRRGDLVFFLMGVVLGGGNDVLSMWRGVYFYTPSTILPVPIPVWMLFFWGQGFLFLRRIVRFGPFLSPTPPTRLFDRALALDAVIAVVYRAVVYAWAAVSYLPGALYASILAVRLLLIPPRQDERRLMLAVLMLGPFYEFLLIKGGLYVYQNGVVLGMPIWLLVYWVFIIRVIKAVFDWVEVKLASRRPG